MKKTITALAAATLFLSACSDSPALLKTYTVSLGQDVYSVNLYSDSTTTVSKGGKVCLEGPYDSVYTFKVHDREYLGLDDYDDIMTVYTPELKELLAPVMDIHDLYIIETEKGRRFGFIYRRQDGKYGMLDEDMRQVYRAVYDSLLLSAKQFEYHFRDSDGNTITATDTLEYVRLLDGGRRGLGDMSGRLIVPMQTCDAIVPYAEHYYSDPDSDEGKQYLPLRHSGKYGDSQAFLGYAVLTGNTFSFYGPDGTLIVPPGAVEANPVYWDDPRKAKYWLASYEDRTQDSRIEGVFRTDGKTIIHPRHHMGLYLRGEDKQLSASRTPHDIMIATGFNDGKVIYEYFDYEGKKIE